jgi:hypothetical protein
MCLGCVTTCFPWRSGFTGWRRPGSKRCDASVVSQVSKCRRDLARVDLMDEVAIDYVMRQAADPTEAIFGSIPAIAATTQ